MPISEFGNLASVGSLFAFNLYNNIDSGEKGVICSFGASYSICSIIVEKHKLKHKTKKYYNKLWVNMTQFGYL